jgi:hypothetical protein
MLTGVARNSFSRARPLLMRSGLRSLSSQATNTKNTRAARNEKEAVAFAGLLLGLLGAGTAATLLEPHRSRTTVMGVKELFQKPLIKEENDPAPRPDLPTIPLEEVAEHCEEDSLWYTFRGGIYDLTFFINGHPGGTPRLLMAGKQQHRNTIICLSSIFLYSFLLTLVSMNASCFSRARFGTLLGYLSPTSPRARRRLDGKISHWQSQ